MKKFFILLVMLFSANLFAEEVVEGIQFVGEPMPGYTFSVNPEFRVMPKPGWVSGVIPDKDGYYIIYITNNNADLEFKICAKVGTVFYLKEDQDTWRIEITEIKPNYFKYRATIK